MRRAQRHFRPIGVAIAALALLIAACAPSDEPVDAPADPGVDDPDDPDAPDDADDVEAEPAEPGVLRIGVANMPPSGVPWTGAGSPGQYIWSGIFDALTVVDREGTPQPALAVSWEAVDETTWIFELREGVEFSNGEPFGADAVVATFDLLLSEEGQATYAAHVGNYNFIESVTAIDDLTVQIETSRPNPLTPNAISIVYIVPPDHFGGVGSDGFATDPIGTGPLQVTEWSPDRIMMERWDGSWRDAGVDAAEVLHLPDPATRVQALRAGQVDVAQSIQPDQAESLEQDGFGVLLDKSGRMMSLVFVQNQGGPLEDQRVRQALNYAVDAEAIAEQLLRGFTEATVWPPAGVHGHDPARELYPYDPDRARDLLAEAGYGDGFEMMAEVTLGAFPADRDVYEAVAGFLEDVGVTLELREIDFAGEWLPSFTGADGAFWGGDAFGGTWVSPPLFDAVRPMAWYHGCSWINAWFCDEEADALIAQVNQTFDENERTALLHEALDRVRESPSAIYLIDLVELWATAEDVGGFRVFAFNVAWDEVATG